MPILCVLALLGKGMGDNMHAAGDLGMFDLHEETQVHLLSTNLWASCGSGRGERELRTSREKTLRLMIQSCICRTYDQLLTEYPLCLSVRILY